MERMGATECLENKLKKSNGSEDVAKMYEELGNRDRQKEVFWKFLDYCLKEACRDI